MSKSPPHLRHSLMKQPDARLIPSLKNLVDPLSIKVEAEGNVMEITGEKILKVTINFPEENIQTKKDSLEYIINLAQQYIEDQRVKEFSLDTSLPELYQTTLKEACHQHNVKVVSLNIHDSRDIEENVLELLGISGDITE